MTRDEARAIVATCPHPTARMERRSRGGHRAVFDHQACVGRRGADKKTPLTRRLIASWHASVPPELWAMLDRDVNPIEARTVRAAMEPLLPPRWRFPESWCVDGRVFVMQPGRKTTVTSHIAN